MAVVPASPVPRFARRGRSRGHPLVGSWQGPAWRNGHPPAQVWPRMGTPQARLQLDGHDLLLLGTIAGYVPDAERVRQAYDAFHPDVVALGIPPEDLGPLDHLAAAGSREAFDSIDPLQQRLLGLLDAFGPTRIPSPDLEAAHACARADQVPIETLDLDDAEHAALFTKRVKFWHVVQSNAIQSRLLKNGVAGSDAYAVADAWDAAWTKPAGMRRLEQEREAHMAARLRDVCRGGNVLAVVPSVRLPGILSRLGQQPL